MELRLFFLPNFPGATFIQGATFIPDSRVVKSDEPYGEVETQFLLFGLLLHTQPLNSSEQHTKADLEFSSDFAIVL